MVTEVVTAVVLADTVVFAVADVVQTVSAFSPTPAIPVTFDFWYSSSSCFSSVTTRAHHMPVRALRDPALSSWILAARANISASTREPTVLIIWCNTALLYMEGSVFKSRGQLACSYFSPSKQMLGCLTLGHNHFLPYPWQFNRNLSSNYLSLNITQYELLTASLNKP